jgi:hypothetical protein
MRGKLSLGAAIVFVLTAAAAAPGSVRAQATVTRAPAPGTSCTVFPPDNVWNMDISRLPVHRKSAVWKQAMHAGGTNLHPDFGPPRYGIPFDVVDDTHSTTAVKFHYASESDEGPYPFGPDTTIEGGSDAHALMVNSDTCTLYELFGATWGASPKAGSGAIFALQGPQANDLRHAGWTSADAAGLPIFPGLVRWDEVAAGSISHAIRFTADCTQRTYLWPARHQAGVSDHHCPPMGARFRLKAGYSMKGFSNDAKVILRAMKHYGMIVADNGSDWYFQGEVNGHWTGGLLDQLKSVPASAFQAVDESGCRVKKNSAAFAYGPQCPAPH